MSGQSNFPTSVDDDTSLFDVTDGTSTLIASHHNNIKEAVKAIEQKVGIYSTAAPTTIDYRLGNPTDSHRHDGASGHGRKIDPTNIVVPSGGFPSGLSLYDHFLDTQIHNPSGGRRFTETIHLHGSAVVGSNVAAPVTFGRSMQIENISGVLRRGPSGATTAFDLMIGPTSIYQASQLFRPIFPAGVTYYGNASPNLITYPSGGIITLDVDAVGSNDPGQDLTIAFVFRD